MQTHLVEIVPDPTSAEESWADWATRNVKENGWKAASAAVVAAPIIPVGVGAIAVGAGLVSGVQNGVAWLRGSDTIQKIEFSKARELLSEQGLPVRLNQVYAVHPDEARSNLIILASEFHNVIIAEQIADLVGFIRNAVRAVSINIEVESERNASVNLGFLSRFSFKAAEGIAKHHSVELRYDDPELVQLPSQPYWLRLFPEIIAAFRGAKRGSVKRTVSVDTTFGITASNAKQAGIDLSWLGKQRFNVSVSFV